MAWDVAVPNDKRLASEDAGAPSSPALPVELRRAGRDSTLPGVL